MSKPNKVLVTRQIPVTYTRARNTYDEDTMSNDYEDETLTTDRSTNSTSNIELIRTRDINREVSSRKNSSSGLCNSWTGWLIAISILLLLSTAIIVPTVLGVFLTRNPSVSNNSTTTTTAPTFSTVFWGFDNNANDTNGTYNGVLFNGATYSNNTYFGYGYNLLLNSTANESVIIASPFLNLTYTSFTVEAWIYGYSLSGDNGVFAQCQCSTCQDQCLYFIIRNYKMYMGFMLDDLIGSTSLSANTWYHVAYVYDYSNKLQSIYLQGVLDGTKSSSGPYQGQNGSILIGSSQLSSSAFNGLIDNVRVTTTAKSASDILADASIVVYFSFDGATLTQDLSANQMNGSLSNAAAVSGRVGQALAFSGSSSYLQVYGFFQLGQSNKAFSFAMWVYPYSVTGGTLIHKTTLQYSGGNWCQDMMGFTYAGQISFYTNGASYQITGPFVSTQQWTHLIYTYSLTNGQTMYINGVQYARTGAVVFYSSGSIDWLTIGYNFGGCTPNPITGGYYQGVIDEFYVYRRELTASDAYSLANP